ncbi:hypothetical protein ACRAWD_31430 [Caulobacter segnis]
MEVSARQRLVCERVVNVFTSRGSIKGRSTARSASITTGRIGFPADHSVAAPRPPSTATWPGPVEMPRQGRWSPGGGAGPVCEADRRDAAGR